MNPQFGTLMPRESGQLIAQLSTNVFIKEEGITKLASEIVKNLENHHLTINNFSTIDYHPKSNDPRAANWLLVIDTLNFCFWNDTKNRKWKVNGETGYFALCAAIKRALENGIPVTDAKYISNITYDELCDILQGDENSGDIPLIDARVKNLNDVGRVLIEKYKGTFEECIISCKNSAEQLLITIVRDFHCFQDQANYKHHRVSFYKRAQILIGDLWVCFQGQGLGEFYDINYITMFADYRVPQVLLHFEAMLYSQSLLEKLKSDTELQPTSIEEVEIRGCSIEVVERVVKQVKILIKDCQLLHLKESDCNSILVDHFLWDYRRKHADKLNDIPYHKVRTIFY